MSNQLAEWIQSWASGVITTLEPDALPPTASPRGHNSFLVSAGGEQAAVQKRRGCVTANATPITSSPAVIGQVDFRQRTSGSTFTSFHLLVSNLGRLDKLNGDGTTSAADAGAATPFTAGDYYPDFAQANNLCFIVNGQQNKKFDGTNVRAVGIATPTVLPTLTASASAGLHNGTYESRYTYYNSNTGQESSASPTSATAAPANKILDHTWTASADAQVTHVKVYIRNTATMSTFRLVATVAIGSVTTSTSVADTSLITVGPDTDENDVPNTLKLVEFHAGRLFGIEAANPNLLVYSKLGMIESFDPTFYEPIADDDGDAVTALKSISNNILLIFKRRSIWAIEGDNPLTWVVRPVTYSSGCTSHRSVVEAEGTIYFWSDAGPMALIGTADPVAIGETLISATLDDLNPAVFDTVSAAVDPTRQTVLFAVSETTADGDSSTHNRSLLPYSYRLKRWHSDKWNPLDIASLATVDDSEHNPWVYIGGYYGQVFKWWSGDTDGVPSGTTSGTVTSATSSTLTCSTATFVTTGGGLIGRYIYAIDQLGTSVQRRRIGSNTATVITLDSGLTWSLTPNSTYTFNIGGPQFEWDCRWIQFDAPFWKKRFQHIYLHYKAPSSASTVYIDTFRDLSLSTLQTRSLSVGAEEPIWDAAEWDDSLWGGAAAAVSRLRVARTGRALRVRVRNIAPDAPFTLLRIGLTAELLSDKG